MSTDNLLPWQTTWHHQVFGRCYTYQFFPGYRWHHWMCDKWYLVPKSMALINEAGLPPYLLSVVMPQSVCPCFPCPACGVSQQQRALWWCCVVYVSFSSVVFGNTSYHMLDNWYFQIFLFSDGFWTLYTWPPWWS